MSEGEDVLDDPDEPIMEGSDDDFSDLEFDDDDDEMMDADGGQRLSSPSSDSPDPPHRHRLSRFRLGQQPTTLTCYF